MPHRSSFLPTIFDLAPRINKSETGKAASKSKSLFTSKSKWENKNNHSVSKVGQDSSHVWRRGKWLRGLKASKHRTFPFPCGGFDLGSVHLKNNKHNFHGGGDKVMPGRPGNKLLPVQHHGDVQFGPIHHLNNLLHLPCVPFRFPVPLLGSGLQLLLLPDLWTHKNSQATFQP